MLKLLLTLTVVLLLSVPLAAGDRYSVTITIKHGGTLFNITNNSTRVVEAMDLDLYANGKSVLHQVLGDLQKPLLQPGQSMDVQSFLSGHIGQDISAKINGIALSDGTTEGPNSYDIQAFVRIRDQVARGGPVYPSAATLGSRGDTILEVLHFLPVYRKLHPSAPAPTIVNPDQDRQGQQSSTPTSTSLIKAKFKKLIATTVIPVFPYMTSWYCFCYEDGVPVPIQYDWAGHMKCSIGMPAPGQVSSTGFGGCPQPNPVVPNKVTINVNALAAAYCSNTHPGLSVIQKLLYGPDKAGSPADTTANLMWGAVAQSNITLYGGDTKTATMIDSCSFTQPMILQNSPGVGRC